MGGSIALANRYLFEQMALLADPVREAIGFRFSWRSPKSIAEIRPDDFADGRGEYTG